MLTAAAIMQLLEKGKIYLAQPVCTIIKEFDTDMHRSIAIFHLLTHTSGLASDPGAYKEPYPRGWFPDNINKDNWIKVQLEGVVENDPGKVWSYCFQLLKIFQCIAGEEMVFFSIMVWGCVWLKMKL